MNNSQMRGVNHVFFDLDRTLWDFEANSKNTLQILFYKYGLDKSAIDFDSFVDAYSVINNRLWQEYNAGHINKEKLRKTRFYLTLKHFKIRNRPLADIFDREYIKISPTQTILTPYAEDALKYLKNKDYKLYIITNGFTEVQDVKLRSCGLSHYFERVYTSEAIGYQKPSPEIFRHAMRDAGASPADSLMAGDDWENDIVGAAAAGMWQLYYNPSGAYKGKASYEIASWNEISQVGY